MANVQRGLGKSFGKVFGDGEPKIEEIYGEDSSSEIIAVDRVVKNIEALCKSKNVRIGDIESAAEVSQGYFSRLKGSSKKKLNVNMLVKASKLLNVPVDLLVMYDVEALTPKELMFVNFIDKLYKESYSNDIDWESYKVSHKNALRTTDEYTLDDAINSMNTAEELVEYYDCVNNTDFERVLEGTCYKAYINNHNVEVILLNVDYIESHDPETGYPNFVENKWEGKHEDYYIELHIRQREETEFVCSTYDLIPEIAEELYQLYRFLSEQKSNIEINDNTKTAIQDFLNGTIY